MSPTLLHCCRIKTATRASALALHQTCREHPGCWFHTSRCQTRSETWLSLRGCPGLGGYYCMSSQRPLQESHRLFSHSHSPSDGQAESSAPPVLLLEGFGASLLCTRRRDCERSRTSGANLTLSFRTYFTLEECQWGLMAASSQP